MREVKAAHKLKNTIQFLKPYVYLGCHTCVVGIRLKWSAEKSRVTRSWAAEKPKLLQKPIRSKRRPGEEVTILNAEFSLPCVSPILFPFLPLNPLTCLVLRSSDVRGCSQEKNEVKHSWFQKGGWSEHHVFCFGLLDICVRIFHQAIGLEMEE